MSEWFHRIVGISLGSAIYIGGSVGPDGAVTGWVAVNAILLALLNYTVFYFVDWLKRWRQGSGA